MIIEIMFWYHVLQSKWSKDNLNGFAKCFGLAFKAAKFRITDCIYIMSDIFLFSVSLVLWHLEPP